jgi:hypothetical protein
MIVRVRKRNIKRRRRRMILLIHLTQILTKVPLILVKAKMIRKMVKKAKRQQCSHLLKLRGQ